jgi:hypothetical protein
MAGTDYGAHQLPQGWAALDALAAHTAVIDWPYTDLNDTKVIVTDTAAGHSRSIPGADVVGIAYAGKQLLIQRMGGDLEVWTASGSRHLDTIEGTPDTSVRPVVGGNVIAEKQSDATLRLIDLPSGNVLGTLPLPRPIAPRIPGGLSSGVQTR